MVILVTGFPKAQHSMAHGGDYVAGSIGLVTLSKTFPAKAIQARFHV